MKLSHVTRARGFASAAFGPLAISIWDERPRVEDARTAADLLTSVARTHSRMWVLAVLGPETPPPESAVRDALARRVSEIGDKVQGVANVVEGQGFRAATMRAVLTGMVLVIRPKYPQITCATVNEGATFLSEQMEPRIDASAIAAAIREMREIRG